MHEASPAPAVEKMAQSLLAASAETMQAAAFAAGMAGGKANGWSHADPISAIFTVSHGVIGSLHVLASLIGHHGDKSREQIEREDIPKLINPVSTLLAAILCHSMSPSSSLKKDSKDGMWMASTVEFSIDVMLDSIQQVERITGRPVDGYIKPALLNAVRSFTKDSEEPMSRFLAQRRGTPGNLH